VENIFRIAQPGSPELMQQIIPSPSPYEAVATSEVESAGATLEELDALLQKRIKISNEIARARKLVKQLRDVTPYDVRHSAKLLDDSVSPEAPATPSYRRRRQTRGNTSRHTTFVFRCPRPRRLELERACRIAMLEGVSPASAEAIYDRIERRGSLTFAGYKRPFRAIVLAMGAMARRGEVILSYESGRPRWSRVV
jgi:hypothetical protein